MSNFYALLLFNLLIAGILALDLGVFHRRAHRLSFREAAAWSAFWIGLSAAFCLLMYFWRGPQPALEYITSDILQKSLSVDNVFLFALIFSALAVPSRLQHRVLFWGVLGAIVLRAIFIASGLALLGKTRWMFYIFGGFLVLTGVKLLRQRGPGMNPKDNAVVRLARKIFPVTENYEGSLFFIRKDRRWFATPLFIALLLIETADLLLAADSIPASFAVSRDPFIVYTSNIMALLGLRAMYFLLAGVLFRLRYLSAGLSVLLIFVGVKMLAADFVKLPIWFSLPVICVILGTAVGASLWAERRERAQREARLLPVSAAPSVARPRAGTIPKEESRNSASAFEQQRSGIFN